MDEKVDFNHTYQDVVKAGGLEVLDYEEFGSYQGEWAAIVKKPNDDNIYAIVSYYGSCSSCDTLQGYIQLRKTLKQLFDDLCLEIKPIEEAIEDRKWDSNHTEVSTWLKRRLEEWQK